MKVGVRAIGAGLAALTSAAAYAGTISDPVISIHASSSLGAGTLNIPYDASHYNSTTHIYTWSMPSETDIMSDNGMIIASVSQLSTFIMNDPVVNVGFVLTAGAANTTLSIQSATLTFTALPSASGQASAQIGATDTDGNGASITGGFGGNLGYRASTNVGTFATLVSGFNVGMFGSSNQNGNQPVTPIGTVSSMSSEFNFTVSANDSASGTSVFVVTPEPASLALLALGGLAFLRRRS
jgi:MYXO-CTERM domain-containing protein